MYQTDYDAFSGLMRDLCAAFNRPLNDDLVRVYWDALKSQPLPLMRSRIQWAMSNLKKFPPPFELKPEVRQEPVNTFRPLPQHPDWDNFYCFAQRCLMKFILTWQADVSDAEMQRLLDVKARLTFQYRGIHCDEDPVSADQFREALMANFEKAMLLKVAA